MDSTQRVRVLLIEDDQAFSDLVRKVIQGYGYDVLAFPDPTACPALKDQNSKCPHKYPCADILITDNMMPNMSGLAFLRLQQEGDCKVCAQNKALMTAGVTPGQQKTIDELGCYFLRKPFKLNVLKNWLDECAQRIPVSRRLEDLS